LFGHDVAARQGRDRDLRKRIGIVLQDFVCSIT